MLGLISVFLAFIGALGVLSTAFILRRHAKQWAKKRIKPESYPRVAVIAPQRGEINQRNIEALLKQDYPGAWEVFFVTTRDDISWRQLQRYVEEFEHVQIVPAEDVVELAQRCGIHRGQKNHNLVTALAAIPPKTEMYAFIDADACPMRGWLRKLITPLTTNDLKLGAVSSARIYAPGSGLASYTQAAWVLGSASFLVGPWCYVWGGGFATPKVVFETADVLRRWDGQEGFIANDDLNLSVALRRHGYRTLFAPDCLLLRHPPVSKENWRDVLRFTNRQLSHVWWVRKDLWLTVLLTHGIKTLALFSALVVAWWQPIGLLALIVPLIDIVNGWVIENVLSGELREEVDIRKARWKVIFASPIASSLGALNTLTAPLRRRMRWGGVEYAKRTVVGYTGDFSWRNNEAT